MKFTEAVHETWMKVTLIVVALLTCSTIAFAVTVFFAYEKGRQDARVVPGPTQTVTTPAVPDGIAQTNYLTAVRTRPTFQENSDFELLESGQGVCHALQQGAPYLTVHQIVVSSGETEYDAAWLISSAVRALCSQHTSKLPED